MCAGILSRGSSHSSGLSKASWSLFLAFAFLLLGPRKAFSQGSAGRILGAVTDQSGGAVVGATVTILDTARGTTRSLTTDQSGEYNAPNLIPSTYTVSAAFQGFKTAERSGVILEVNQELRVDLTLQPGEQAQKIIVTEALPMVETTNAELGGTLQSAIIVDLPMNGRNFANLLQLRPGVTIYPGGSGWTQSTNGQRAHDNMYLFDGVNGSDPWMSQPIISAVMAAGDAGTLVSIDAIDEFKTEENPRAEYGWKPGAIVNVGIKSGTNAITVPPSPMAAMAPGTPFLISPRRANKEWRWPRRSWPWNSLAPPLAGPSRRTSFSISQASRTSATTSEASKTSRCPLPWPAPQRLAQLPNLIARSETRPQPIPIYSPLAKLHWILEPRLWLRQVLRAP